MKFRLCHTHTILSPSVEGDAFLLHCYTFLRCGITNQVIRGIFMSKATIKRRYPTPALEKGLDILELFASPPGGLTVSEVARLLNRTVSEIFRMLLCLEQRGYLAQSENRERYHLTLRLLRLAQEHPPTKRLVTEALPIMHGVAHEVRQSCHLGI